MGHSSLDRVKSDVKNETANWFCCSHQQMPIKLLINDNAKKIPRKHCGSDASKPLIDGWCANEKVKCYAWVGDDNTPKAFALLSKMTHDPLGRHSNPYVLDYIYTLPAFRRTSLASQLLEHIKNTDETTAFVDEATASHLLFTRAAYKNHGQHNGCLMFRYP